MLQINLYFYCHSDTQIISIYKISLSSLELCFCALAIQTHQNQAFCNHQSITWSCFRKGNDKPKNIYSNC